MTQATVAVHAPKSTGEIKKDKKSYKTTGKVENPKAKFVLWFIVLLLVIAGFALLTIKGQPLSDFLAILKRFFKAIGDAVVEEQDLLLRIKKIGRDEIVSLLDATSF